MKTYSQAMSELRTYLQANGWTLSDSTLKVQHATRGNVRVWFKTQAIHYTVKCPVNGHKLNKAHSIHTDVRKESPSTTLEHIKFFAGRHGGWL